MRKYRAFPRQVDADGVEPQQQRQAQHRLWEEDRKEDDLLIERPAFPLITRESKRTEEGDSHGDHRHQQRDRDRGLEQLMDLDRVEGLLPPLEAPLGNGEDEVAAGSGRGEQQAYGRQIHEDDDREGPGPEQGAAPSLGTLSRAHQRRPRMTSRSNRRSTSRTSAPTTTINRTARAEPRGQFWA